MNIKGAPGGGFFRRIRRFDAEIGYVFQVNDIWRKKTHRLGMLANFKLRSVPRPFRAGDAFVLVRRRSPRQLPQARVPDGKLPLVAWREYLELGRGRNRAASVMRMPVEPKVP